jgi:hypothetical protein
MRDIFLQLLTPLTRGAGQPAWLGGNELRACGAETRWQGRAEITLVRFMG